MNAGSPQETLFTQDLVPVNITCIQDTPECIFQIVAYNSQVEKILDVRLAFPNSSLSDLYDPLTMPVALLKAHNELDKAVDLAYRPQAFTSEANRMVFLFELPPVLLPAGAKPMDQNSGSIPLPHPPGI